MRDFSADQGKNPGYNRRLACIARMLPPDLARFGRRSGELHPHDGIIRSCTYLKARQRLELKLRCGDLQRGYCDWDLSYEGIKIGKVLNRRIRRALPLEILDHEVDLIEPGLFEHRILFERGLEFALKFHWFTSIRTPVSDRHARA